MTPETAELQAIPVAEKPLRRDAERNRQLILAAGRELFAERGLGVTLDDIAERAGVGVGTVYRRFPDRDALVDALFTAKIEKVVALADEALTHEDPLEGLASFLRGHMLSQQADRAYAAVIMSDAHGRNAVACAKEQLQPIVGRLVERCHAAGQLRADLDVSDVPMIILMLGTVVDATRDLAPDVWERYFTILLDGIRADAPTPLPTAALSPGQVLEAMRCGLGGK